MTESINNNNNNEKKSIQTIPRLSIKDDRKFSILDIGIINPTQIENPNEKNKLISQLSSKQSKLFFILAKSE